MTEFEDSVIKLFERKDINDHKFDEPLFELQPQQIVTDPSQLKRPRIPHKFTGIIFGLLCLDFVQLLGIVTTASTLAGTWPLS
eukprot:gene9695-1904_t